jgi:hypothetical protein
MKLVFLTYLEDDDALVVRGLRDHGVLVYSRLPLEGRGRGAEGWYGEIAPFRSSLVFAVLPDADADRLMEAIGDWPPGQDPGHPVRAFQVDVERAVRQGETREPPGRDV